MANQKPADSSKPQSRLDRVSRDLNRSFLHGARAETTTGTFRPAMVVTGQQIPVDVPASGGLTFTFEAGAMSQEVVVKRADVISSEAAMRGALATPDKYLRLEIDRNIPTWVFHQREFTLPDPPVPEDTAQIPERQLVVLRLPAGVLQQIQAIGQACDVSLVEMDAATQTETPLLPLWRPAILLRFPLQAPTTQLEARRVDGHLRAPSADDKIFEVGGTPQGERYYLDQLHLLPDDPAPATPIESVTLLLQEKNGPLEVARAWTIARTNLTQEARPASGLRLSTVPAFPFVATNSEPEDTLRLLQMASITNSGGYFLRTSSSSNPDALVVCVVLKPGAGSVESGVPVPLAANAVGYRETLRPHVARIEGRRSVHVTPFVPSGYVSFGWTRSEPVEKQNDEERFGFGTISLVDFQASDAAGHPVEDPTSRIAISPLRALPGDHVPKVSLKSLQADTASAAPPNSAAMRLLPQRSGGIASLSRQGGTQEVRHYRASLRCYNDNESPFAPLADPTRRAITIEPGFRDVFGNSFAAVAGAQVQRALFYTDALVGPREWPGVRFTLYPTTDAGRPHLSLEAVYSPLEKGEERTPRYLRLLEIRNQLLAAKSDVQFALMAPPLLRGPRVITSEVIKWLNEIIAYEHPGGGVTRRLTAPLPLVRTFRCDVTPLTDPKEFAPTLVVTRLDKTLLPSHDDLPDDEVLSQTIAAQIAEASGPVYLSEKPSGSLFRTTDTTRKDEFRLVAQAFQTHVADPFGSQVGFGRNQLNEHELWFIPNGLLPSADQAAPWSFATARPMRKTLGTEQLLVPDFTKPTTAEPHWRGFKLEDKHFVEQDFDELARSAFSTIEQRAVQAGMVTDPTNIDAARNVLSSKDKIARALAGSDGIHDPAYLVPLFEGSAGTLEPDALTRLGTDAFLQNLRSFYTIDTFVQLPLQKTLDSRYFAALEAKVENPFAAIAAGTRAAEDPSKRLPSFSDVLLKAGEKKATVIYDVPPGTRDPNDPREVPAIPQTPGAFSIRVTHVQRKPDIANVDSIGVRPFNRGSWLELAQPVQLSWRGLGGSVPVAVRRFPAKPILQAPSITPPEIASPITEASVPLLARWGWKISFVAEGLTSDLVHATVRYNEPATEPFGGVRMASSADWEPVSLLHCLIVLRQLGEHWLLIPAAERLPMVAELLPKLEQFLGQSSSLRAATTEVPHDQLDIDFPSGQPVRVTLIDGQVMRTITASASNVGSGLTAMKQVELNANANANTASLITPGASGAGPVYNLRPSLRLVRNERIGAKRLDPRLIYECATVEAPRERWALNTWPVPFTYSLAPRQNLLEALRQFFRALFARADLTLLGIEVGASLESSRESLAISTPYSIVPVDMAPASADAFARTVFDKCQALLGGSGGVVTPPPEMDRAALRLRIKVSLKIGARPRTLVEIEAIDFPLSLRAMN